MCANGDSRCNQNAYNDPANPIKYTIDTDVVLQPATRTGYDFTSWIDVRGNSFAEIVGTRMSGNKKLYAQWTPKIIHCEPGEFLPAYSEQCVQCDEENIYCPGGDYVYSDKPDGKKDCPSNYPFAERGSVSINQCFGQCPDDGVGNVHANGEKSCRYSINYVLNGGEFNTEYPTYYDSGAGVLELVSPVKDNYRFVGWYTDSGMRGSPIEYINTNGYGHVTLYAKWQFYCESGKWLHVGHKETDKICLYSEDNKPALPTMVFDTSDGPHYIMLTDDANTHMHEGSNRKFRLKIGNRVYNAYDASVITY